VGHPERIVPDETEPGVVALHLGRYEFAEPWCEGRVVLDLACGTGYGSAFLARSARRVVGGDRDEGAVAYARRRYARPNVEFLVMDAARVPFPAGSFDVVCSFETIEHLLDRDGHLAEIVRVLRPDGSYLVSTPRAKRTTERPANPYHRVEYAPDDFRALLERSFEQVELYGQRRRQTRRHRLLQRADVLGLRRRLPVPRPVSALLGTPPTAEATLADVVIELDALERASELVAVCSRPRRR
jgi:SAM-dependent methyltransferase